MEVKNIIKLLAIIFHLQVSLIYSMSTQDLDITNKKMDKEIKKRESKSYKEQENKNIPKLSSRFKITKKQTPLEMPFREWCKFIKENWFSPELEKNEESKKAVLRKYIRVQNILNKYIIESIKFLKNQNLWFSDYPKNEIDQIDFDINKISLEDFNDKIEISTIPHAQKLIVPQKSRIFIFGDTHGNFDAVEKLFNNLIKQNILNEKLKIQGDNYIIFLGDYTDRGSNGLEILLTLFRLKMQNPNHVILLRGNHESFSINSSYGFVEEMAKKLQLLLETKVEKGKKFFISIFLTYEFMPTTAFLGFKSTGKITNFIQLSHGLIDHKYNYKDFLDSKLPNNSSIQLDKIKLTNFMDLENENKQTEFTDNIFVIPEELNESFCWSDISTEESIVPKIDEGRGDESFTYNTAFLRKYFNTANSDKSKITKIIRGHEHNIPAELRNYDQIGAAPIGNLVYTLMSGIYTTKNFDWKELNYLPTFIELSPQIYTTQNSNEKQEKEVVPWNIKIKYIKNGGEKIDTKFEITKNKKNAAKKIITMWKKYKERLNKERNMVDEKLKKLKINKNLDYDKLLDIAEEFENLPKETDIKRKNSLSKFIKKNYFTGNNIEFSDYIKKLKYKSNYQSYIENKLINLIVERMNEKQPDL